MRCWSWLAEEAERVGGGREPHARSAARALRRVLDCLPPIPTADGDPAAAGEPPPPPDGEPYLVDPCLVLDPVGPAVTAGDVRTACGARGAVTGVALLPDEATLGLFEGEFV